MTVDGEYLVGNTTIPGNFYIPYNKLQKVIFFNCSLASQSASPLYLPAQPFSNTAQDFIKHYVGR